MFKKGFLSRRFPEEKMVVKKGVEGWIVGDHFLPKAVIEDTIFEGRTSKLKMDNITEECLCHTKVMK